jgi:hypothetical protein
MATKALSARKAKALPKLGNPSLTVDTEHQPSPNPPAVPDLVPDSPTNLNPLPGTRSTTNPPPEFADSLSENPVPTHPPPFGSDPCPTPWQSSPSPEAAVFTLRQGETEPFDTHNYNLRRGSLPVYAPSRLPFDDFDSLGRRRSVDNSLLRLASHPFAHLARAKNGAFFGSNGRYSPSTHAQQLDGPLIYNPQTTRHTRAPINAHRTPTFDFSAPAFISPTPFNAVRSTLYGTQMHVMSSRPIVPPLPGPLPSPGYSFGAAAASPSPQIPSPIDPRSDSPGPMAYVFRRRSDDLDTEDDATTGSYDAYSRFGSMVSLAGSESSNTSAYYSDVGSCVATSTDMGSSSVMLPSYPFSAAELGARCSTNGTFLGLMSGLDVNSQQDSHTGAPAAHTTYPPQGELVPNASTPIPAGNSTQSSSAYPSPSSTVSPCQSPHTADNSNNTAATSSSSSCIPISRSSELAYALRDGQDCRSEQQHTQCAQMLDAPVSSGDVSAPRFFYVPSEPSAMYTSAADSTTATPEATSSSSLTLPLIDYGAASDKYAFDAEMPSISATGHYQASLASYAASRDARRHGHGMEFARPPVDMDLYAYGGRSSAGTVVDRSSLDLDSYGTYV